MIPSRFRITRSSLRHLRFPFSLFLLPVYLMALIVVPVPDTFRALIIGIALHLLLYPGSSGFNAFYDRDRESVGMLVHPPPVTPDLLPLSLIFKAAAVSIAVFAGWSMACGALLHATASILYSWDRTRLKRRPFAGWLLTGTGQGFIMSVAVGVSLPASGPVPPSPLLLGEAVCMALMMLAASPLLELFQHEEDARRGDLTISRFVGVRGTLLLSGMLFTLSTAGFIPVIGSAAGRGYIALFLLSLLPALLLFSRLSLRVFRDGFPPGYRDVMPVALFAAGGLNLFCAATLVIRYLAMSAGQ